MEQVMPTDYSGEHAGRIASRVAGWIRSHVEAGGSVNGLAARSGIRRQLLDKILAGTQRTVTADQFVRLVVALKVRRSEAWAALADGLELPGG